MEWMGGVRPRRFGGGVRVWGVSTWVRCAAFTVMGAPVGGEVPRGPPRTPARRAVVRVPAGCPSRAGQRVACVSAEGASPAQVYRLAGEAAARRWHLEA